MFMKWIDILISIYKLNTINCIYGLTASNYQTTELLGITLHTKVKCKNTAFALNYMSSGLSRSAGYALRLASV